MSNKLLKVSMGVTVPDYAVFQVLIVNKIFANSCLYANFIPRICIILLTVNSDYC